MTQSFDIGRRKRNGGEDAARLTGRGLEREAGVEESYSNKQRVLHTRVPAVLERELKRVAESLRVPVANLVRAVLEDAVSVADRAGENVETRLKTLAESLEQERDKLRRRVLRDPLNGVFAFQPVKLAQPVVCVKCGKNLNRGASANLGLRDDARPGIARVFVCNGCVPSD